MELRTPRPLIDRSNFFSWNSRFCLYYPDSIYLCSLHRCGRVDRERISVPIGKPTSVSHANSVRVMHCTRTCGKLFCSEDSTVLLPNFNITNWTNIYLSIRILIFIYFYFFFRNSLILHFCKSPPCTDSLFCFLGVQLLYLPKTLSSFQVLYYFTYVPLRCRLCADKYI